MAKPIDRTLRLAALTAAAGLALGSAAYAQSDVDPSHSTFPQTHARRDLGAPSDAPAPRSQQSQTVPSEGDTEFDDLAHEHAELSVFAAAVKIAGLENSLTNGKDYTVFAPTNEALQQKRGKDIDSLLEPESRAELVSFLRAHIVADAVDLRSPRAPSEVRTVDGETVGIDRDGAVVMVDDARVVNPNGIEIGSLRIYAIDDVLARGKPIEEGQVRERGAGAEEQALGFLGR
jgi:uncharacterized surface protein with fasciclin (FAS1) repeats